MRQERRFGALSNLSATSGVYMPVCDPVPTGHRYNGNLLVTNRSAGALTTRLLAALNTWPSSYSTGGVVAQLTSSGAQANPAVAPNGNWMVDVATSNKLEFRRLLRAGFGLPLVKNAPVPTTFNFGGGVAPPIWSPSGKSVIAPLSASPYVAAYSFDPLLGVINGRFADPGVLPVGAPTAAAFSPDGKYVAFTYTSSPYIAVYPWDDLTGFGTKFANPGSLPSGATYALGWMPDGTQLFFAFTASGTSYPTAGSYQMGSSAFSTRGTDQTIVASLSYSIYTGGPYNSVVHADGTYFYVQITYSGTVQSYRLPISSSGLGGSVYIMQIPSTGSGGQILWLPPRQGRPYAVLFPGGNSIHGIYEVGATGDFTAVATSSSAFPTTVTPIPGKVEQVVTIEGSNVLTLRSYGAEPLGSDLMATFAYDTSIASKAQLRVSGFVLEEGERLIVQESAAGLDFALSGVDIS